MSMHRLASAATRTLASRFPRLSRFALALSLAGATLRSLRPSRQRRLLYEGTLCRIELGLYHLIIVPLVAFLPAPLAYGMAYLQGNLRYHLDRARRAYILEGLEGLFGDQLSPAERIQVTRDYFRLRSCEAIDVMRMAGKGRALARLVEIRGLEHIEAALAAGNGVILCGAHFGSYSSCFSLLGAQGVPITLIGHIPTKLNRNRTLIERLIFRLVIVKPLAGHWHRPLIEPRGQMKTAVQVASILRHNEVLGMLLDPPVPTIERARAIPMKFLNGQVLLLPGVTALAQMRGTPLLMTFMRRSPDWRHQILEISPPMPMEGDALTSFKRCLAVVEAAIRQNPAHWHYCGKYALLDLGLLPAESAPSREEG